MGALSLANPDSRRNQWSEMSQDPAAGAESANPSEPAELLGELNRLRKRTRSARHAYWFPLVLFGVLTVAATPLYILSTVSVARAGAIASGVIWRGPFLPILGGESGYRLQGYLGNYWLAAILAGLVLTALWYRRHANRVGLVTPARGYLITGTVLTVVALVLATLSQMTALRFVERLWPGDLIFRGTFPFLIIAAGLGTLAWAERSRALAIVALIYTGTALLVSLYEVGNIGWN